MLLKDQSGHHNWKQYQLGIQAEGLFSMLITAKLVVLLLSRELRLRFSKSSALNYQSLSHTVILVMQLNSLRESI